jgi:hypothetical protein
MKRLAFAASAILLAACGNAAHTTASTAITTSPAKPAITHSVVRTQPTSPATKTVIGANGTNWAVIDNDGTYLVWVDIPVGKYRNTGGTECYWALLRSPDTSDIIDSNKTRNPQEVTIRASDTAFLTRNCGTWQMISPF